jgi:hypothetical protein
MFKSETELLRANLLKCLAPILAFVRHGNYFRNSSGSFAIFAAIRRASSLLSSFAAEQPPDGTRPRRKRMI